MMGLSDNASFFSSKRDYRSDSKKCHVKEHAENWAHYEKAK